ncbi:thioredoxin family protein [Mucilaginibacter ximonensis]|uniref:Thioredoxin family protein n=1 Tax=Mucilaginibacter ximonensis TaxID=538021 RepID=A0ABW5YH30_9SPHI
MTYADYNNLFQQILDSEHPHAPYDAADYLHYTRLNQTRMRRWDRQLTLNNQLVDALKKLDQKQHWIIITEPWCGDAAHILPFLMQLAACNPLISYDIQLRDSPPFLIESYLTNGAKSIPKLIVRDEHGADIFNWGPRPKPAQQLRDTLKAADASYDVINNALQQWYNQDKGVSLCEELLTRYYTL